MKLFFTSHAQDVVTSLTNCTNKNRRNTLYSQRSQHRVRVFLTNFAMASLSVPRMLGLCTYAPVAPDWIPHAPSPEQITCSSTVGMSTMSCAVSPGSRIGTPCEICTSTSKRNISSTTTDLKTVHVCSQDSSKIPEYKTPLQTCTFRFDAGRVMCATYTTEKKNSKRQKYEWHFYTPPPLNCFDRVQN